MRSQEVALITPELLERLIEREFPKHVELVRSKFEKIKSDSAAGQRRIFAAVLKLADGDLSKLHELIEKANFDFRDIIMASEYARGSNYKAWLDKN